MTLDHNFFGFQKRKRPNPNTRKNEETKMRLLKILISLAASADQSEAFNERRWYRGQPSPAQGAMQRQGPISSPDGGFYLEACTPFDAQPSICK